MNLKQIRIQKSRANSQRRWQEQYLKNLPNEISNFLASQPFFTTPEHDNLVDKYGIADIKDTKENQHYCELFSTSDVLHILNQLPNTNQSAWLMPLGYGFLHDSKGGLFEVPFNWAKNNSDILWPSKTDSRDDYNLVTKDGSTGILIESWSASPIDKSNTGNIYGVRFWPSI